MSRVFVSGIGVITALGECVEENHAALVNGDNGLSALQLIDTKYSNLFLFGEVKIENERLKKILNVSEDNLSRTTLLALHAMSEALHDSKLTPTQITSSDTALILANTVGGMCLTDNLYNDSTSKTIGSNYLAAYDYGATALFLQNRYQIKGVCNTINTACSSSANAIMFGARLIKNGLAKRVIVGGADSLAKYTINGFNALGILSPSFCKPFDEKRDGLNLAEGAGFLILEHESVIKNKKVYAELSGYGNSNDAFHASTLASNGEGPYRAIHQALAVAKLNADKIGFVNTHGTGTENNDIVESVAMKRIFEMVPPFASSKSKIGHTLGAAGCIEAVFCLLSLQHQEIYASLNFINPINTTGLIPVQKTEKAVLNHIMSNSFGFGGNCSSLIFSKI